MAAAGGAGVLGAHAAAHASALAAALAFALTASASSHPTQPVACPPSPTPADTYTRFPSLSSVGGQVRVDTACASADQGTYTNCTYTTLIVTGAPGNQEVRLGERVWVWVWGAVLIISYTPRPRPQINPASCNYPYNVKCSGNYGYGKVQVANRTHVHWTWATTVPVNGTADPTFSDDLWVVKGV